MNNRTIFTALFISLILPLSAHAGKTVLVMKGVEIAKGSDIGEVRYGTKFTGEILDGHLEEIGYWYVTLDYRGAEEVEVCGGQNDIIRARMTVVLDGSSGCAGMAVIAMQDATGTFDVFWDYSSPLCGIGGLDCPYPWDEPLAGCLFADDPDDYGPVARVGNDSEGIFLRKVFATGFFRRFSGAEFGGWLRHNYPFIPRVDGTLTLIER